VPEHDLEFSTTRGSEPVAIYVEMPFGGILVEEDFLDIPVGNWLYKPDELKSNRIPISGDIHW
jgi:hypothetical protein